MTSQFVVFVVGDVLVTATFVEIPGCVISVYFYFFFRDKLTQKLQRVLAVDSTVALA